MMVQIAKYLPIEETNLLVPPKPENENERNRTMPVTKLLNPEHVFRWGDFETGPEKKVQLRISGHDDKPLSVAVDGAVILGRSAQDDEENQPQVSLNDYGAQTLGVSRQHVALLGRKWGIRVVDLRSKNGTYLNGAKLPPYQERILRDGDELRLGHMIITIRFVE